VFRSRASKAWLTPCRSRNARISDGEQIDFSGMQMSDISLSVTLEINPDLSNLSAVFCALANIRLIEDPLYAQG
jgi:hypothetical protein